jgi:hypothetical protein
VRTAESGPALVHVAQVPNEENRADAYRDDNGGKSQSDTEEDPLETAHLADKESHKK